MKVRARIELFRSEVSMKEQGYYSGVCPNHKFPEFSEYCIGRIEFEGSEYLALGESAQAIVDFIGWPPLRNVVSPGTTWQIREGPHIVGSGIVEELLE